MRTEEGERVTSETVNVSIKTEVGSRKLIVPVVDTSTQWVVGLEVRGKRDTEGTKNVNEGKLVDVGTNNGP